MNPSLVELLRRIVAAELQRIPRSALAKLSGSTDQLADAIATRARQSPDWPILNALT